MLIQDLQQPQTKRDSSDSTLCLRSRGRTSDPPQGGEQRENGRVRTLDQISSVPKTDHNKREAMRYPLRHTPRMRAQNFYY